MTPGREPSVTCHLPEEGTQVHYGHIANTMEKMKLRKTTES